MRVALFVLRRGCPSVPQNTYHVPFTVLQAILLTRVFIVSCSLLTTHSPLLITHYPLRITHHLLPTPHSSQLAGASPPSHIASEADGQSSVLATWGGKTRYLDGPVGANVAFDAAACTRETHAHQTWVACPDSLQLRSLKIYSPDRGDLVVLADGVRIVVPFRNRSLEEGPTSYGGSVVLPNCVGTPPTDCMNYMWPGD